MAERKSEEPLAVLLAMIYLVPILCVVIMQPSFFSPRYFLVILPFLYVPAAMLLARLITMQRGRIAVVAVLALFLAGQTHLYTQFLQVGRGQFTAALQYMIAHTSRRSSNWPLTRIFGRVWSSLILRHKFSGISNSVCHP